MLRHLERINIPLVGLETSGVASVVANECLAIISDTYFGAYDKWKTEMGTANSQGVSPVGDSSPGSIIGVFFDKMFVSTSFVNAGFSPDWFRQDITTKDVYVQMYGHTGRLPDDPRRYLILGAGDPQDNDEYKKIETSFSKLSDIFKMMYGFGYDSVTDQYERLSAKQTSKNLNCYLIQYEIMKKVGDDGAILHNHATIIKRLAGAVHSLLSPADQVLFNDLSSDSPTDVDLLEAIEQQKDIKTIIESHI